MCARSVAEMPVELRSAASTETAYCRAIMAASPGATEIGDRRQAIFTATAGLETGDLLVLAGKGHERGQIVGATTLPFDDVAVAREAVSAAEEGA